MFKALATAAVIAIAGLSSLPAEAAVVRTGNLGRFQGVTTIDRGPGAVDTLRVPFPEGTGVVNVRCASGDYEYNGLVHKSGAEYLIRAWCRY